MRVKLYSMSFMNLSSKNNAPVDYRENVFSCLKESADMKTLYEFETAFSELMDTALSTLSPEQFDRFKDSVSMILEDYEE